MANSIDFTRIILPDDIKSKLEFSDDVNLFSSSSGSYLDFDHDLQLNLDKIFSIHSTIPHINVALDRIIIEIFGKPEIRISAPKYKLYKIHQEVELSFKGLLNNQDIELCFGKQTTLKYQLNEDFIFSNLASELLFINDLKLSNPELIITDIEHSVIYSKLGCINLNRGFNFIVNIDFNNLQTNFSSFIHRSLGIGCLGAIINFNPAGQVSLTGNIAGDIQLFSQQQFKATFNNLLIGLNIGADLEPNFGLTGNLILQGYDPTQEKEPNTNLM